LKDYRTRTAAGNAESETNGVTGVGRVRLYQLVLPLRVTLRNQSGVNDFSATNRSHRSLRWRCVPGCCSCTIPCYFCSIILLP